MVRAALSSLSDHELYDLLAQDDEAAFALLYKRYWKRLIYKALLKLDNEADAEEVVQEIFIDLWNSRHRIRIQYSVHTYLAAMVRYKIMARIAASQTRPQLSDDNVYQLSIPDHSTEQWLNFADLRDEIEAAVKALPEKCQLVFRLSREQGMTDRQIAAHLDISQKTVEAHISKALKTLHSSLGIFFFFIF